MLDTPPEVRAAHRMRVKFLSGVKAGSISDIPSVAIVPLPDSEVAPDVASSSLSYRATRPMLAMATGPIRRGATVRLEDDKAGFEWKVEQILPDGKVEVSTIVFERRTTLTVPRERVQILARPLRQVRAESWSGGPDPQRDTFDQSAWVSQNLSPDRPRRHVDVVAESIVLGPRCLDSCRNRFYQGSSAGECADRFRAEIRMKGVIQQDRKREKQEGRIRVDGRFELILPDDFRAGDVTTIEDPRAILDLRPHSQRPKRPRKPVDRRGKRRRRRPKSS